MEYTELINAVIALVVSIIGVLVTKNYIDGAKLSELLKWVQIFVSAAEKLFPESGSGEKKNDYVKSSLADMGYTITPEVNAAIEAAVLEVGK